ncbi:MAG: DmsC/YnfH family molybdoenzyme membrane anchor subunit [Betaproteobacteria bacterium]
MKNNAWGPNPWQQTSWDWRAAGNFIGGGMGTGLLLATALLAGSGATFWLVFVGLALVGVGLTCVWLEIGRPLRALHVFFNPRTSWMSREAFVGALLFPSGLLALLGLGGWLWVTAALALAFLYCQSRMLAATRGIPAWRSPWVSALFLVTAACEGCGVFLMLCLLLQRSGGLAPLLLATLLVLRVAVWTGYRRAVKSSLAPRAAQALDAAGQFLWLGGTLVPLALLASGLSLSGGTAATALAASAGLCAAFAGAQVKYTLVTRASFNQGFALLKMPVRGVSSTPR